jgi:Spy/CpxP family protein refolding chaperone
MKTNKLIPFTLCAVATLACSQFARAQGPDDQAGPPHHHGPHHLTEMLTHTLNLTDAQKPQVQAAVTAVQPQLDAIHQQAHTQANAVLKQLDTQIRPFLTPEQVKKLDALETLRESHTGPGPE